MEIKKFVRRFIPENTRMLLRKLMPQLAKLDTYLLKNPREIKDLQQINPKYIIREATWSDRVELEEAHHLRGVGAFYRKVERRLDAGGWRPLVVMDTTNNKIAYISWVVSENTEYLMEFGIHLSPTGFLIKDGYCVPQYRKQGLHTRMEQERLNFCVRRGATEIYIQIHKTNTKGADFLEKIGFIHFKQTLIIQWSYFLVFRPLWQFVRRPFKQVVD